jgi:hypothetical protein
MHHVSVLRSVADTYHSSKIDIKKQYFFLIMEKTHYRVRVYIACAIGPTSYIRVLAVLCHHGSILTDNLECGRNHRLIP